MRSCHPHEFTKQIFKLNSMTIPWKPDAHKGVYSYNIILWLCVTSRSVPIGCGLLIVHANCSWGGTINTSPTVTQGKSHVARLSGWESDCETNPRMWLCSNCTSALNKLTTKLTSLTYRIQISMDNPQSPVNARDLWPSHTLLAGCEDVPRPHPRGATTSEATLV